MKPDFAVTDWDLLGTAVAHVSGCQGKPFTSRHLSDFAALLRYVDTQATRSVNTPAAHLFKAVYRLNKTPPDVLRRAIDMAVRPEKLSLDLGDLDRLHLAMTLLSAETLEISGEHYLRTLGRALGSSTPQSFRSRRLYSRALYSYWLQHPDTAVEEIRIHAASSLRILYALLEVRTIAASSPLFSTEAVIDDCLRLHFDETPGYIAASAMYEDYEERIKALLEVKNTTKGVIPGLPKHLRF